MQLDAESDLTPSEFVWSVFYLPQAEQNPLTCTYLQRPSCAPSRRPLSMARCGSKLSSSQSAFAAESRLVAQQPSQVSHQLVYSGQTSHCSPQCVLLLKPILLQASVQQACVVTCKLKTRKVRPFTKLPLLLSAR